MSSVTVSSRLGGPEAWLSCSPDLLIGCNRKSGPPSPRCTSPLTITSPHVGGSCRSVSCSSSPKSSFPLFSATLGSSASSDLLLCRSSGTGLNVTSTSKYASEDDDCCFITSTATATRRGVQLSRKPLRKTDDVLVFRHNTDSDDNKSVIATVANSSTEQLLTVNQHDCGKSEKAENNKHRLSCDDELGGDGDDSVRCDVLKISSSSHHKGDKNVVKNGDDEQDPSVRTCALPNSISLSIVPDNNYESNNKSFNNLCSSPPNTSITASLSTDTPAPVNNNTVITVSSADGTLVFGACGSPVSSVPVTPVSSGDSVPVSSAEGIPVSRAEGILVSIAEGIPVSIAQGIPVSIAQGIPVSSAEDIPVSSADGIPVGSADGIPVGSAEGIPVNNVTISPATSDPLSTTQPSRSSNSRPPPSPLASGALCAPLAIHTSLLEPNTKCAHNSSSLLSLGRRNDKNNNDRSADNTTEPLDILDSTRTSTAQSGLSSTCKQQRIAEHVPVTCTVSGGSIGTESTLGGSGNEGSSNSSTGGTSEQGGTNGAGTAGGGEDGANGGDGASKDVSSRSQQQPTYDPYGFEGRPLTHPQAPSNTTNYSSQGRRPTPPRNTGSPREGSTRQRRRCLLLCCCCRLCARPSPGVINPDSDPPPSLEEIRAWSESFDRLMRHSSGRRAFSEFLRCEYSEENILFWQACEDLKKESNPAVIEEKARNIYEDFISILSPKEVSLDSRVREIVNRNMVSPTPRTFDEAQKQIYTLMHRDSFPRFINSSKYKELAQLI